MANLIITITKAVACGKRVGDILALDTDSVQKELQEAQVQGDVEFRNVSVRYTETGEAALENISFHASAGQTVGIIGGTGSGKTSLVNLISGLYQASSGAVMLDGRDIRQWNEHSLRHQIGTVPQKAVLFRGTVRDNLCWRKENAADSELWDALELAQAHEILKEKDGLDTPVEQGGSNFSGGQRQRLTIARALVGNPKIIILDDSASALDYATDARLRASIRRIGPPPTTFIVSQRAASVRHADLILVLDDGMIVGRGTHEALMKDCDVYQEIYYSQFRKEAADNATK
jgi:ABC-type multidrug transport system fused ATPase/permease subunit